MIGFRSVYEVLVQDEDDEFSEEPIGKIDTDCNGVWAFFPKESETVYSCYGSDTLREIANFVESLNDICINDDGVA